MQNLFECSKSFILIKRNLGYNIWGSVRFAENVCAKKFAKLFQFVDDNLPTHNLPKETTFFGKFSIFYTVKKMSNHNLPTYDLPKRCFNDANVVLMTLRNDQQ